jgi:hypothetical protein
MPQLHHDGQPITFTAVAARTGLGRTTLYRNPALRAVIEDHRHRAATGGTLTGIIEELSTLRTALDAIAARVGGRSAAERKRTLSPFAQVSRDGCMRDPERLGACSRSIAQAAVRCPAAGPSVR